MWHELASAWSRNLVTAPPPPAPRRRHAQDMVSSRIWDEAEAIKRAMTALKYARGEPFKEEHWTSLFKKVGMPRGVKLDTLTVGHFLDVLDAVAAAANWLKDLHSRAQGEVTLREALQEVKAWLDTAEFKLMEHASAATGRRTPLIKEWKDLFTQVGDNQSLLTSLKDSPYFKPFADTAALYEASFAAIDEGCQKLSAIQRRWVYLEPVFSRGALPSEQARFKRVDDDFRDIMGKVAADPRAGILADTALFPGLSDALATMLDQLERCQRALSDFLGQCRTPLSLSPSLSPCHKSLLSPPPLPRAEERRSRFPRFYFIGDDDLLEILGQSQNPAVIQVGTATRTHGWWAVVGSGGGETACIATTPPARPSVRPCLQTHLKKLYQGVFRVEMTAPGAAGDAAGGAGAAKPPPQHITAMCSAAGEVVRLRESVAVTEDVTQWLNQFTAEMIRTLSSQLVELLRSRDPWDTNLVTYPSQLLGLAEDIKFAEAVESALAGGGGKGLEDIKGAQKALLAAYTLKDVSKDLLLSSKVKALVLDVIHRMDVCDQLIAKDVKDPSHWLWQKQLRFYLDAKVGGMAAHRGGVLG